MSRKQQENKYIVGFSNGSSVMLTASRMSEAKNIAKRMGEPMTVQRIYKNSTRVCQNIGGKVYSI